MQRSSLLLICLLFAVVQCQQNASLVIVSVSTVDPQVFPFAVPSDVKDMFALLTVNISSSTPPHLNLQVLLRTEQNEMLSNAAVNAQWPSQTRLTCPSVSSTGMGMYNVLVTGSPGISFIIEVTFIREYLEVDGPAVTQIANDQRLIGMYFGVDAQDVNSMPYEIVAESDDEEHLAILFVVQDDPNRNCPDSENVLVDDPNTYRLTFSTQGTINVGLGGTPRLNADRYWFVGVLGLSSANKPVNLRVQRGAPYSTLGAPVAFIVLVSLAVVGFALAITHFGFFKWACPVKDCGVRPLTNRDPPGQTFDQLLRDWCIRGNARPFSFSWFTIVVACSFGIATYQVVFSAWARMENTGNLDGCYYNERCFRPIPDWQIPFNAIVSNYLYIFLGLAFNLHIALYEWRERAEQDCSIFYALGWSVVAEGWFSGLYHICPTNTMFQFDTAFMFIITSMTMIAVYQTGESPLVHKIKAAKYFVFFIIPLLIFNYIGALADTDHNGFHTPYNQGFYWFAVIVWQILIFSYVKWRYVEPQGIEEREAYRCLVPGDTKCRRCCCGSWGFYGVAGFIVGITLINAVYKIYDTSYLFLFLLLLLSFIGIFRIGFLRAHLGGGRIFVIGFIAITGMVFWVLALMNFTTPVTDKSTDPWLSREGNAPCVLFDYWDSHDLWHIEGSFGLFFILLLVLHFNPPVNETNVAEDIRQLKNKHGGSNNNNSSEHEEKSGSSSFGVPLLGSRKGHLQDSDS